MKDYLALDIDEQTLEVNNRESDHREFKLLYESTSLWKYAKTMASFANKNGGVIIFGVSDNPRVLKGIDQSTVPDSNTIANFVNSHFEPEILFDLNTKTQHDKTRQL